LVGDEIETPSLSYLARTNLYSCYDAEGRHPGYWYTQVDSGLYWVEENLTMVAYGKIAKVNYTDATYYGSFSRLY
jgi:hypothetical protein